MSAPAFVRPLALPRRRAVADRREDPDTAHRCTLIFLAAFVADWIVSLAWDATGGGLPVQYVIAAMTWIILFVSIRCATPDVRRQAVAMVLVASVLECVASLVVGLYTYRYHNVPLYVPPGHGLFFLAAVRICALPHLRRFQRLIVAMVALISTCWMLHGLIMGPWGDVEGALWWPILIYFLIRGRDPLLFAVTFVLTMALEFYGTGIGAWHWTVVLPITHVTAGNPPSACAAGYCILDALARRLAPWLAHLVPSSVWRCPQAAPRHQSDPHGVAQMGGAARVLA